MLFQDLKCIDSKISIENWMLVWYVLLYMWLVFCFLSLLFHLLQLSVHFLYFVYLVYNCDMLWLFSFLVYLLFYVHIYVNTSFLGLENFSLMILLRIWSIPLGRDFSPSMSIIWRFVFTESHISYMFLSCEFLFFNFHIPCLFVLDPLYLQVMIFWFLLDLLHL